MNVDEKERKKPIKSVGASGWLKRVRTWYVSRIKWIVRSSFFLFSRARFYFIISVDVPTNDGNRSG
jgi:hypothetical protein